MRRRIVPAAVLVLAILEPVASISLAARLIGTGGDGEGFILFAIAIGVLAVTATAVGLVIRERVPSNRIGPLLIIGAIGVQSTFIALPITFFYDAPWLGYLTWWANVVLVPSLFLLFPAVGVSFPDGHLPGPRWRWPVGVLVAMLVVGLILTTIGPWPTTPDWPYENPFAIPGVPIAVNELGGGLASAALLIGCVLAVVAVVTRFRRADHVERAQIKWLIAALSVFAIAFPLSFATDIGPADIIDMVSVLVGALVPVAIGVAILRYRLYDIDRLVSRTVSWAIVTGGLLALFAALVIGLQTAFAGVTQGGTVAVAISTLVAAALFQPARRRVQRAVDRRFDRAHYDAERTSAAFADRLRHDLDLESLAGELRSTVGQAVRPTTSAVWLVDRGDG